MKDLMRAARRLDILPDDEFFAEVSQGMRLIAENVASYDADRRQLAAAGRDRGADLLHALAQEEAAKYLILVDAVRCPKASGRRAKHLSNFYSHFAKGIYAVSLVWRPSNLADLRRYIDQDRDRFYLDGPMDVDWLFRNPILEERERLLYVDYIDVWEGDPRWVSPRLSGSEVRRLSAHSEIVELVLAMHAAGISSEPALSLVARKWRGIEIKDSTWVNPDLYQLNHETVTELHAAGLLVELPKEAYHLIVERWPFPLYTIDFGLREIAPEDIRRERDLALLREMGESPESIY